MSFEYKLDEQSPETQRVQSEGGVMPASLEEDVNFIQAHLAFAIATLEARDTSDLDAEQIARREALVGALEDYRAEGVFPINTDFEGTRVPYFVDDFGTRCAMGHLIDVSGHGAITEFVRDNDNNAKVQDLAGNPALVEWLDAHGMTAEEAALVQPSYGGIGGGGGVALRYPLSDMVRDRIDRAYGEASEKLDGSRDYVIRVTPQTLDDLQETLELGATDNARDTYVREADRIVTAPLTTKDAQFPTGRLAAWPDPKPTSKHTGAAAQSVRDAGENVKEKFGELLDAHKAAIEAWRNGNTYITQEELRDVKVAVEAYDAAREAFYGENRDWVGAVNIDGNMPQPQMWAG